MRYRMKREPRGPDMMQTLFTIASDMESITSIQPRQSWAAFVIK